MDFNQVMYLQFLVINEYMRRHNLTPQDILELDEKKGILRFLELAYEPLHLTGIDGIIEEVENYLK